MKALVTGGNGFLGKYIVQLLVNRGYAVSICGRSPRPQSIDSNITYHQGHLDNASFVESICKNIDVIFHVAAKAGIWGKRIDYWNSNVQGTQNLLHSAKLNKVPYFIHTSTPSVVFNRLEFKGDDESLPYGKDWLCHYAETKAIAEQMVLDANDLNGTKVIALRPHLIWGLGDPHIVPRIVKQSRKQRLRIIGNGTNQVDITHVSNAADAHLLALDALKNTNHPGGKAYFLSQGQPVRLWGWINNLLRELQISEINKTISFESAYRLGTFFEIVYSLFQLPGEPPMTRFIATELSKSHYFSTKAIENDLGYKPNISNEQGLSEIIQKGNL